MSASSEVVLWMCLRYFPEMSLGAVDVEYCVVLPRAKGVVILVFRGRRE